MEAVLFAKVLPVEPKRLKSLCNLTFRWRRTSTSWREPTSLALCVRTGVLSLKASSIGLWGRSMTQIAGPFAEDLTEAEKSLIMAVNRGEVADLKRQTIRASVLRDLILESRPGWTVPHAGVRVHRAIIDGELDLEGCTISKPLLFWHSRLQGGSDRGLVLLRDAKLKRLGIHSSTVEGSIIADRVQVESGVFIGGGLMQGVLQIRGADVHGALAIEGTEIGDGKTALRAAGLRLSGPLILRRARIKGEVAFPRAEIGAGIYGEDAMIECATLAMNGESARISGDVLLDRANITGGIGFSYAQIGGRFSADGLTVSGVGEAIQAVGLNVGHGVSAVGAKVAGTVRLDGADIGKAFRAEAIEIEGGRTAILADVIRVGGNWDLARAKLVGQLSCPGADINGQLRLTEAHIYGADLAIRGDGARIRGGCFLSRATVFGLIRFPAAEFGNQFRLRGASLKVDQGAALFASGSTFNRDVELNGGLQTIGAIVLDQAKIKGVLDLRGSGLKSAALARDGAPPPQSDPHDHAAQADEVALSLIDADVDRLEMPEKLEHRPRGIVDLSRAHAGAYLDYAAAWPPGPGVRGQSSGGRDIDHIVLDGFSYDHLINPAGSAAGSAPQRHRSDKVAARRVAWLEGQHEDDVRGHFKPQAWVQLASRLAAQGYRDDARDITIARMRRERRSAGTTSGHRWQGRILDLFALYGFNPWRTVIWMAMFILLFAGLWSWAATYCEQRGCLDERVFVVSNRDAYTQETFKRGYPEFNALGYSFDVFVPFVSFGYEDHWRPNIHWQPFAELALPDFLTRLLFADDPGRASPTLTLTLGGVLYISSVVEMLLGLILTSLAVTGFTGLLKGSE